MKISVKMVGLGLLMAALALPVFAGGGQQAGAAGDVISRYLFVPFKDQQVHPPFDKHL
ncbi:hypothetical protein AGMMS49940_02520 [Spirochaetia bacterium]|nr:hypothetical protein AGMMS49940_02520 [Spirochaetia bacterium]